MSQYTMSQCYNTHRHNVTVYSVTPSQNTSVYSVTVESHLHCKLPCLDSIYGPVRIGGQIPTLSIQIILIVIFYRKSATLNPNFDQLQFKWLEMACQGFIGPYPTSDKWGLACQHKKGANCSIWYRLIDDEGQSLNTPHILTKRTWDVKP